MDNFIEQSGIIGYDLPNIYIETVTISDKQIDLIVYYYKYQNARQNSNLTQEPKLRFAIFQMLDNVSLERLSRFKNGDLLRKTLPPGVSLIKLNLNSSNTIITTERFANNISLQKFTNKVSFRYNNRLSNLNYLLFPFIDTENDFVLTNNTLFVKRTKQNIMTLNNIKKNDFQYKISNTVKWYGDIVTLGNAYYSKNKDNSIGNKLIREQIPYRSVIDLRQIHRTPAPAANQQSSQVADTTEAVVVPITREEIVPVEQQPAGPYINKTSSEIFNDLLKNKSVFNLNSLSVIESQNDNISFGVQVDLRQVILNTFIDKSILSNSLLEKLCNTITTKKSTLLRKFIPNDSDSINEVGLNQKIQERSDGIEVINQQNLTANYTFKENLNIDTYGDSRRYKYFVKIIYEANYVTPIKENIITLEKIKNLLNNLELLTRDYIINGKVKIGINEEIKSYNQLNNFLQTNLNSIIKNYADIYDEMNSAIIDRANLENLLILDNLTLENINYFHSLLNNLLNKCYEVKNLLNEKSTIIEYEREIHDDRVNQNLNKNSVVHLANIDQGSITLENFINRIKQEKGRLFTQSGISYSDDLMFSYLSPESFFIRENEFKIPSFEQQTNVDSQEYERYLNNIIINLKYSNLVTQVPNLNTELKDNNIKDDLFRKTTSYLSKKYGLTINYNLPKENNKNSRLNINFDSNQNINNIQSRLISNEELKNQNTDLLNYRITKLNQMIDFNKNFNTYIPNNIRNLPNHMLKARSLASTFNTYKDMIDYGLLMEVHIIGSQQDETKLLTKEILISNISNSTTGYITCKLVPHTYEYNQNIRYKIEDFINLTNKDLRFIISFDRTLSNQYLLNFINTV